LIVAKLRLSGWANEPIIPGPKLVHTQIAHGEANPLKNIFVGNLGFNASEDVLRQLFVAFGPVNQVKIMIDDYTGKSRGFGFVEMANAGDGEKAITALNGTLLDDRALNVNEARPKKEPGSFRDRDSRNRSGGGRRW
jgi:cold-inducible RNA-binding protein